MKEELSQPASSPPLSSPRGTRWREQSGVGDTSQQLLVGCIFISGVTWKPCGCIFSAAQWAVCSPGLPWRGLLRVAKLELHLLGSWAPTSSAPRRWADRSIPAEGGARGRPESAVSPTLHTHTHTHTHTLLLPDTVKKKKKVKSPQIDC